jgi:23S rRNA pseudouridine1911/1915/1917 synthase
MTIHTKHWVITAPHVGLRLDKFLYAHMGGVFTTRSQLQNYIENTPALVNTAVKRSSYALRLGDTVSWQVDSSQVARDNWADIALPDSMEGADTVLPFNIIYEDYHMLVIDKPVGLVVHPGAGDTGVTLVHYLIQKYGNELPGEQGRLGIVHRLDRNTSGLMVVAKTETALVHLSQQFAVHAHTRVYKAIVALSKKKMEEYTENQVFVLENYLARQREKPTMYYAKAKPDEFSTKSKWAKLQFSLDAINREYRVGLATIQLYTGRTHQIRVQMTHNTMPLLGDTQYTQGLSSWAQYHALRKPLPNIPRVMLHSHTLGVRHPITQEYMEWALPLPSDMAELAHVYF